MPDLCYLCGKKIKGKPTELAGGAISPLHYNCKRIMLEKIVEAYEKQKSWEKKLNKKQKTVISTIKEKALTLEEISAKTELPLTEVNSILKALKKKVQRKPQWNGDDMTFTYKVVEKPLLQAGKRKVEII